MNTPANLDQHRRERDRLVRHINRLSYVVCHRHLAAHHFMALLPPDFDGQVIVGVRGVTSLWVRPGRVMVQRVAHDIDYHDDVACLSLRTLRELVRKLTVFAREMKLLRGLIGAPRQHAPAVVHHIMWRGSQGPSAGAAVRVLF